jgi:membrane protein DedA with SNARE-associated domain
MLVLALFAATSSLGYALPALVGLESMGIPSPGETALILAAVLASQGKLNILLVIVIGVTSAIVGDNIGYVLGRRLGREALSAPGPFQKHRVNALASGDRFFDKHGSKAVFLGRWVALVRIAAAWLAGINKMKFSHFFFWNALGGITWGTTIALVGYWGGQKLADAVSKYGLIAAIVAVAAIVAAYALIKLRERRRSAAGKEAATPGDAPAFDGTVAPADGAGSGDPPPAEQGAPQAADSPSADP